MVFKQGSNVTFTRAANLLTIQSKWDANSKLVAGYVAAPGAVASKVWKTDANGNPDWRDDATGDNTTYTIGSGNTKIITLTGSDSSTSTVTFADGADISISGNNGTITITNDSPDSGLPAVLTDGNNPGVTSLYTNTTAAAVRATIEVPFESLTTTGTSGASTLINGILNVPNYADTNTTYTAGDGINFSGNPATQINADINYLSYSGANNFIDNASDQLGSTIPTQGRILYRDTSNNKIISMGYVSDLPFTNNTGTIQGVTAGTDLTGGGTSGTVTLNNSSTLATVTGRGATTSTACSFTNTTSFLIGGSGTANLYLGNIISPSSSNKGARFHSSNNDFYMDFQGDATQNWFLRDYDGACGIHDRFGFNFINGTFTATGDVVAFGSPSDIRLKENIKPIESALDKAIKLQGVTFDWKENNSALDLKEDIGFIAQDVQKVLPELVRENKDGMLSMRHQGITPILLEAIKELKAEIEELKKQIK